MVYRISSVASYTTGISVGTWGVTVNDWVAIIGLLLALMTFFINWWYRYLELSLIHI